jgi:NAD(P)H-hydrate epimerase
MFLTSKQAKLLDHDLIHTIGYSLDSLMEMAGLTVAQVIYKHYPKSEYPIVTVLAGPGNNGGDALIAAYHLSLYGYKLRVCYPKVTYPNLMSRLHALDPIHVEFTPDPPLSGLVLDGLFGFGFNGSIRPPFDLILSNLYKSNATIVSIDVPSGWAVDEFTQSGNVIQPHCLISLTAPKPCSVSFKGLHVLGGVILAIDQLEIHSFSNCTEI